MYYLIDKNLLLPEIYSSPDYLNVMIEFYKKVYQRNLDYCSNIYVIKGNNVGYESIIESDGKYFYSTNLVDNQKLKLDLDFNYIFIQQKQEPNNKVMLQNSFTTKDISKILEPKLIPIKLDDVVTQESKSVEKSKPIQMDIVINEKIEDKKDKESEKSKEDKKKNEEKEKKKELLLKTCEQVMDLYNLELSNIKKTENQIKTLNYKLEKLEKKKREQIIKDITRTKSDYETWKKLKYNIGRDEEELIYKPEEELELREELKIPILFTAKYNYIEKSQEHEKVKEIYCILNKLNIDELYIADSIDLDPKIIKFCEQYYKTAKNDLHYKFDHDWDYLDTEMNTDSKGGSLPMSS